MLNEQRVQHLREAIQASSLLDDHEKADWLNLLELMNDKQLSELEEILAAPKSIVQSSAAQPAAREPVTKAGMPPLSHIANVPTNVASTPRQTSQPVIKPSPSLIQAKPAPISSSDVHQPVVPRTLNPTPVPRPAPVAPLSRSNSLPPMNPLTLKDLVAVQALNVNIVRQHEHSSIISAIQTIAETYGYFATIQNFESSQLYKAYLTAGKNRLASNPDSTLSQAEFELVTDMLQAMRVNRG